MVNNNNININILVFSKYRYILIFTIYYLQAAEILQM